MESLVMNYSDEEEEDVFPSEVKAESSPSSSRTPNCDDDAMQENIMEMPDRQMKILLEKFGFPLVVITPCDLKDAVANTNESPRNQIEDDDHIKVVSDVGGSKDAISSIVISSVETVVYDQDYCKSSEAISTISSTSFVEHEIKTDTAMDFYDREYHNGYPISNKMHEDSLEDSAKKNPMAANFPISSSYLVGQEADFEIKCENHSILSPKSEREDEESVKENSMTSKLPISFVSLVEQEANTAKAIDLDNCKSHNVSLIKDEQDEQTDIRNPVNSRVQLSESQAESSRQFEANNCDRSTNSQKYQGTPVISDRRTFKCKLCSYSSTIQFGLKKHMLSHSENSNLIKIKCEFCPFKAKSKNRLSNHLLVRHKNQKSKCTICDTFVLARLKENHLLKCKATFFFETKGSQYKTIYERLLEGHQIECSNKRRSMSRKSAACGSQCGKLEKSKQRGEINESSRQPHRLEYCSYSTRNFKRHIVAHTVSNRPIYRCSECGYKSTNFKLSKHMKTAHKIGSKHTSSLPNTKAVKECDFCSYTTRYSTGMMRHRRLHTVRNKPIISCTKCDYKAPQITLTRHYKNVHGSQKGNLGHLTEYTCKSIYHCPKCDYKAPRVTLAIHYKNVHGLLMSTDEIKQVLGSQIIEMGYTCKFCSFSTRDKCNLIRHTSLHTVHNRPLYHCPKCDYKAPRVILFSHYKNVHGSRMSKDEIKQVLGFQIIQMGYTCKFCSYSTHNKCNFNQHTSLHTVHNRPLYHCPKCDYKAPRVTLSIHYKNVHGSRMSKDEIKQILGSQIIEMRYTCKFCSYSTRDKCNLIKHSSLHTVHNRPLYYCPKCDYKAPRFTLFSHYKNVHGSRMSKDEIKQVFGSQIIEMGYRCKFCSYSTHNKFALNQHTSLHTVHNRPLYHCPKCDYKAPRVTLSIHYKNVHGSRMSKDEIKQVFGSQIIEMGYRCKFCSYSTHNKFALNQHTSLHTVHNRPLYHCPKCDYKAPRVTLSIHYKNVHGSRMSKDEIKQVFGSQIIEMGYTCKFCSYSTRDKCNFYRHTSLHAVHNRPLYHCPKCDYKAPRVTLSIHYKNVHGSRMSKDEIKQVFGSQIIEMGYRCKFCSYSTHNKFALNQHTSLHTVHNRPLYHCPKCDYKAPRVTLSIHYKNVHGSRMSKDEIKQVFGSQIIEMGYTCKFCSYSTRDKCNFYRHTSLHAVHNRPLYRCPKCDYTAPRVTLFSHYKNVHGSRMSKDEIKQVLGSQIIEMGYTCKFCSYSTHNKCNLNQHTSLHTVHNRPLYHCPKCDYNAPRVTLFSHYEGVHGSRMSKDEIKQVLGSQIIEMGYTCKFCSYSTRDNCNLSRHTSLHTVHNRPIYHCPKCDYKSTKMSLAKHVKTVHKIQSIDTKYLKKSPTGKQAVALSKKSTLGATA